MHITLLSTHQRGMINSSKCCEPSYAWRIKARNLIFLTLVLSPFIAKAQPALRRLKSPHGTITFTLLLADGVPTYTVTRENAAAILPSHLGLAPNLGNQFHISSQKTGQHRESWRPVYGERSLIPDNYNQLDVTLSGTDGNSLLLEVRAYDEGVAFRYGVTQATKVEKEVTEFHLPAESFAYEEHGGTEGEYFRSAIDSIAPKCQSPLTISLHDGSFAAILEAANVDFPTMYLGAEADAKDALVAGLASSGTLAANAFTPWRLIMAAKSPGELLEHNYLQLDLNDKQAVEDSNWIKPGKIMREVTLSTEGAKSVIDFDAAHNMQYVLFDWGWYGVEDPKVGDATQTRVTVRRADGKPDPNHPPFDLPAVLDYAKQHAVGVWLYVDRRQIRSQRDILFPLYEKWGVKGVKIGFVDVGTQEDIAWINETIRKAAEHQLMLDIHDQYRPTGYTRTYPNLLSVEGVRGNEHFPTAEHDTTLPFTRYLAGSADYTVCYYDKRLQNTHAHQMATMILSYSPVQSVFWYDKPSAYKGEPEIKWFEETPTVWDETRVPLADIGKFAVLARRSGRAWYIGAVADSDGASLDLPMSFLTPGQKYEATIYYDDPTALTATHVSIQHRTITNKDTLGLKMISRGGEAIYLEPISLAHSR
jgi:alpha-glucosidase